MRGEQSILAPSNLAMGLLVAAVCAVATTAHAERGEGPAAASLGPPSGALLWSNVSEAGMGQDFSSAMVLPGGGGDVLLLVPDCDTGPCDTHHLGRLRSSTGALKWGVPQPPGFTALALAGAEAAPVAVVWTTQMSGTAIRAHDATSGQLIWERDNLLLDDPAIAVSTDAFFVTGVVTGAVSELGVRAIALSLQDGSVLLNATVAEDNTTNSACAGHNGKLTCQRCGCAWNPTLGQCQRIDWYARSATLVRPGPAAGAMALIGTEVSEIDSGTGFIMALDLADGHTRWIARNVTAARL